jgi:predicted site-specific integrase-resolvase
MEQTLPQMINEKQAARVLSVSVAALRRWRHEGRGPQFARLERCIRYDVRELTRFLERNSSANKKAADSRSAAEREARVADATTQP